jgi:diamine N-acetyltransferase
MIDMHFRAATAADAEEIAAFMTRNFLATYGHSASPKNIQQALSDYYGVDAQHADLADEKMINCLCIIENKIAGLAQIKPAKPDADQHQFELARFYVDTAYHGQGVAALLMQTALEMVHQRSAHSIWLSVWQEAAQAIRFYQKQGFVIRGDTIFMIGDEAMNDYVMIKNL